MVNQKRVRDLMLSLSEYAVVPESATLAEALAALEAAQTRRPPGSHPHRAVLVTDRRGRVVGKLGHKGFLAALQPDRPDWQEEEILTRAGVSDHLRIASAENFRLLGEPEQDVFARARRIRVAEVCAPHTACIPEGADLFAAVRAFLAQSTLSLLVCSDHDPEQTIGILRLADLFDALAAEIGRLDHEE